MTGVTRSQAHFGRHAGSVAAAKHQNAKKRDRTALGAGTNREFFSCLLWQRPPRVRSVTRFCHIDQNVLPRPFFLACWQNTPAGRQIGE